MSTARQAKCEHCGKKAGVRSLKENPSGGARCKDWFACQQRRDAAKASRGHTDPVRAAS